MERQPISREGYDKIREEIRAMEDVDMPAVTERIKTAREEGDLKENAEYHAARETQGYLQAKINQLKSKLSSCFIVERNDKPKDSVVFGATVKVKDLSDGSEEAYELVGPGEEDYDGDVMKILTSSPIATAMLG
jgi:transcription elongation factor GreA